MPGRTDPARSSASSNPVRVRFDRFELDEANARLLRDGTAVALAPTPFAVLCALVRQPGSLLTTNALLDEVWGHQFVTDSVLRTAISELRTALDDDARKPRFIETVSRRGYRFIAAPSAIPAAPGAPPNVSGLATVRAPYFIGRAEPLSRLRHAWDIACSGKRAIVWIAGEPGIGKTTLIEQFIASLGDVACARGQCVEHYGTGESYLPVLEALEELCRSDSEVPSLLRAVAPTWLLQLPWLSTTEEREALRRELAGVSPDRMLREMGHVLDRYTERRPLLLVTEDLHWSDRATIQLIDCIARRRGSARLMWLASFRLAEVVALDHPLNPLRHELRLHRLCEEIVLDPFSETEVADYIAQRSPSLARDEGLRACAARAHRRRAAVRLVGHHRGDGTRGPQGVRRMPGRGLAIAVPENLAAIIDHYIARLDSEPRAVLSAAAVCGVEFRVDTVALALERASPHRLVTYLRRARREQVWPRRAPRAGTSNGPAELPYSFRHALFRQVQYERTAPVGPARTLHRKVGAALERERGRGAGGRGGARHAPPNSAREPTTALRYYAEAAEAALAHFSPDECISLTERARPCSSRHPMGWSATRWKSPSKRFTVLPLPECSAPATRPRARSSVPTRCSAKLRSIRCWGACCTDSGGCFACARNIRKRSRSPIGRKRSDRPPTTWCFCRPRAPFMGRSISFRAVRPPPGHGWSAGSRLPSGWTSVLVNSSWIRRSRCSVVLAVALCTSVWSSRPGRGCSGAHVRARRTVMADDAARRPWHGAMLEVRLGDAERVAALADEMQALVDEFALAHGRTACRWFRGWADARMGQPRDGHRRRIREAYEDNTRLGMLAGGSEVLGYATEALVLAGDWDGAQHELEDALQVANTLKERVYLPQLFVMQAAIARGRGDRAAADAAIRRAIAEARAQEAPWLELMALIELCDCHSATAKDRRALAALIDQLPEALDTPAAGKARALLDKTKSA